MEKVDIDDLTDKTDSKGIIRLIKRAKSENSYFNFAIIPLVTLIVHLAIFFYASLHPVFKHHSDTILSSLVLIVILQSCMFLFACQSESQPRKNLMNLLKAPEFPPMAPICPHCLTFS
mgnify:CR=1 FL=1